jgi:hypothetical protein
MTILRYITQDGRMIEQKTVINERYIEMRDGFHPMTNDCVFQDSARRKDNSIIIAEQCTIPLFSEMGDAEMSTLFREYVVAESKFKQPTVSKMWTRTLIALWNWIRVYGVPFAVALFVIYIVGNDLLTRVN